LLTALPQVVKRVTPLMTIPTMMKKIGKGRWRFHISSP